MENGELCIVESDCFRNGAIIDLLASCNSESQRKKNRRWIYPAARIGRDFVNWLISNLIFHPSAL
jgi:hypothetical protein